MNYGLFLSTLPYMLKGMVGIFLITAVIILFIVVLNRLTSPCKRDDADK